VLLINVPLQVLVIVEKLIAAAALARLRMVSLLDVLVKSFLINEFIPTCDATELLLLLSFSLYLLRRRKYEVLSLAASPLVVVKSFLKVELF